MPLYEYKCRECGRQFESYRRLFDALKEETCPSCGGRAERSVVSLFRAGGSRTDGGGTCGSGTRRSPFG